MSCRIVVSRTLSLVLLLSLVTASTGCRTMRPIQPLTGPRAEQDFARIEIGDLVIVETADGARHRFEVTAIEGDALVAESGRRYPRADMKHIEREAIDARKTTALVTFLVVGYYIFFKIVEATNLFGT